MPQPLAAVARCLTLSQLIAFPASTDTKLEGIWGMALDATGSILTPASKLSADHLPRGDDAITFDGQGVWVTGTDGKLVVSFVDEGLGFRRARVP